MLSDAPAHQLFCLLGPVDPNQTSLPEILCVVQLCLEGQIAQTSVGQNLHQGKRPHGDMIPWTVAQQVWFFREIVKFLFNDVFNG